MTQIETCISREVTIMLDRLNSSKFLYDATTNESDKQEADKTFADCYDWFTQQHFAIDYDERCHLWLFAGQYEER